MDVLNAVRVRAVWDVRLWRTSRLFRFIVAQIWPHHLGRFEKLYRELLAACRPVDGLAPVDIDRICLLCMEKSALQCHRRLAAEYIAKQIPDTEIVHL